MSKTAKTSDPLTAALEAIDRLPESDRRSLSGYAAADGRITQFLNEMAKLENGERVIVRRTLERQYNQDGSPTKPKGRKPRRQEPEKGGGDG